ncbi:WcbI family polysaccharide biosynthesis putative acetyltransferase [Actinomycetes bacterium M1A6_2h]
MMTMDGRTRHYGEFYGIHETDDDRPLVLILGNCQAEALRVVLDEVTDKPYRTMRIPPVHELTDSDVPHVRRAAAKTATLLTQPIRSGYRDLPIGTDDVVAHIPATASVVRWPVLRYAGLYPFQVIVRHPSDPSADPAVVPYHDLRTVSAWSHGRSADEPWDVPLDADTIRSIGDASVAELARREARDTDVAVSDRLSSFGADAAHTINHPGNGVLVLLAMRILAAMDVSAVEPTVDRVLLRSVMAPLDARVLDALGSDASPRPMWRVGEENISADDVHRGQMAWYDEHPVFVTAAVERHRETMDLLGLTVGDRV